MYCTYNFYRLAVEGHSGWARLNNVFAVENVLKHFICSQESYPENVLFHSNSYTVFDRSKCCYFLYFEPYFSNFKLT